MMNPESCDVVDGDIHILFTDEDCIPALTVVLGPEEAYSLHKMLLDAVQQKNRWPQKNMERN